MATIMAVGAHPDDIEIGIGGTLARAVRQGHRVIGVDLTDGEETPYGNRNLRAAETAKATEALGLADRICLDLPNRLLMDTEDARLKLGSAMRTFRPDIVFTHHELDAHPDHVAAFQITRGAALISRIVKIDLPHEPWRPGPLYSFICSHLRHNYRPSFVLEISEEDLEAKLNAVRAYESQFVVARPEGWVEDYITTRARYFGSLGKAVYGEAVLTDEVIGLANVFDILGRGSGNTPRPLA